MDEVTWAFDSNRFEVGGVTFCIKAWLGSDIGGAKELRVIYFPTNGGAKEPQNLPNHRVAGDFDKNQELGF